MFALALAVGNAYCFERCLVDSPKLGTPPCHQQQDKPSAGHCAEPHNLNIAPPAPAMAVVLIRTIESATPVLLPPLARADRAESPPPLDLAATNLPLRI
jgi:hypothetical protein